MTCNPRRRLRTVDKPGQKSGTKLLEYNFQNGVWNFSPKRQNWLGDFSYCKKTGPNFSGKFRYKYREHFRTRFCEISGPTSGRVSWLLWPLEKAGNPSAPVRPLGVQTGGNRQDPPALKYLEHPLLLCLLRLHWGSNLRGSQNVKHFFCKLSFGKVFLR